VDDRDLMAIRVATLYRFDGRGRLIESNEPNGQPAPRLFFGRTMAGDVVRFGASLPNEVAGWLEEIIEREPPVTDLSEAPVSLDAIRAALSRHAPIESEGGGPAYRFPETISVPDYVVQLTDANRELARETFPWLYHELPSWWPGFAVVQDGVAVSVCFSSRIGTEANEAGVETLADYRGRGYAAAVTAAWGAAIREAGRVPLYSTSWGNVASQSVARRLGLVMFGADASLS
jgi:hypothetical protein